MSELYLREKIALVIGLCIFGGYAYAVWCVIHS